MYYIIRVIEDANSDAQSALIHIFLPFILFAYTAIGTVVLELLFRVSIGLLPHMRRFFKLDDSLPGLNHAEALIPQAAAFAENAHAGQFRKGPGKVPYFTHRANAFENLVSYAPGSASTSLLHPQGKRI